MIVTNESTLACCGESVANCKCEKHEQEPAPVVNFDRTPPVGGSLGLCEWEFNKDQKRRGIVTNHHHHALAEPVVVTNAKPAPSYVANGLGQFDNTPKPKKKVDDSLPVGGSLGMPLWRF